MSSNVEEDDYANNIDDQLLSVAKQEGVEVHGGSGSIKLEHLAATNKANKDSQQVPQVPQPSQSQSQQQQQLQQQQQQLQQQAAVTARQIAGAQDPYKRQYQQLQQQQQQRQQQQQQLHQHQHQQQQQQQQAELHTHYNQADDLDSEYNIQIPDPIVDTKSKIYPVSENTITADGNLITRPYPEQAFHNRDDLNDFIQEFARDNGFGVVISHSNKKAIYYTCELGGRYRHKKSKKDTIEDTSRHIDVGGGYLLDPNTKTKKLRCPFAMTASYKKSTGVWTLRTTCNEHNHPQLDPLSNHPMLRKRSDELNLLILDLYKVGTKPSHIESKIKEQYPDVIIKREDIYNEIRGYKRKLKKQNARFGFASRASHNKSKMEALQAAGLTGNHTSSGPNTGPNDESAAAAAAVAAATNAILSAGNVDDSQGSSDPQVLQYQHSQQQQDEFSRQFISAAVAQQQQQQHHQHHHQHHQIDDSQYQQYQHLQDHDDSTAAAAIAAVTNATRHGHFHHNESDLSMENIDSRLVGE